MSFLAAPRKLKDLSKKLLITALSGNDLNTHTHTNTKTPCKGRFEVLT